MGDFCAVTGYTPTEFWEMEQREVAAIAEGVKKKNV
jgi:hypothetical protein